MGFKVGDPWRTNQMSLDPGGVTVIGLYKTHPRVREYTRIKNSYAYIKTMLKDSDVIDAYVKK